MPVSASALCRIVSFTAANTSRMFDVSVACVRLFAEKNASARRHGDTRERERRGGEGEYLTGDKDLDVRDSPG